MTEALTYAGETLDDALSRACAGLNARLGEIRYEVVREGGGAEPGVEIAASIDPQAAVGLFLSELFRSGGLGLHVHLESSAGVLVGEIASWIAASASTSRCASMFPGSRRDAERTWDGGLARLRTRSAVAAGRLCSR